MPKKKKSECRSRLVQVALTSEEYIRLKARCEETVYRTLSDYMRALLFRKKIVVWTRNRSFDELLPVAGKIGDQLDTVVRDWGRLVRGLRDSPEALEAILAGEAEVRDTVAEIKSMLLKFIEDGCKDQDMRRDVHHFRV